jgi:hypothetical protein
MLGFFLVFLGLNGILMYIFLRKKSQSSENIWNFGNYQIIRKK